MERLVLWMGTMWSQPGHHHENVSATVQIAFQELRNSKSFISTLLCTNSKLKQSISLCTSRTTQRHFVVFQPGFTLTKMFFLKDWKKKFLPLQNFRQINTGKQSFNEESGSITFVSLKYSYAQSSCRRMFIRCIYTISVSYLELGSLNQPNTLVNLAESSGTFWNINQLQSGSLK